MATLTYRATAAYDSASSASAVVPKPAGAVEGDLVFVEIRRGAAIAPSSPASGWDLIASETSAYGMWLYYKVLGASEPSSWTWTWAAAAKMRASAYACYGDFDTSDPIQSVSSVYYAATSSTSISIPSLTTTRRNTTSVLFPSCWYTSARAFTVPAGYTEHSDAGSTASDFYMAFATKEIADIDTITGVVGYSTTTAAYRVGVQVMVQEPAPPPGRWSRSEFEVASEAGWAFTQTGGTVTSASSFTNDLHLRLYRSGAGSLYADFTPYADVDAALWFFQADLIFGSGCVGQLLLLDSGGSTIASLNANAGTLTCDTDAASAVTDAYTVGQWRRYTVLVNETTSQIRFLRSIGDGTASGGGDFEPITDWLDYSGTAIATARVEHVSGTTSTMLCGYFVHSELEGLAIGDSVTAGHTKWNPNPNHAYRQASGQLDNHDWPRQFSGLDGQAWVINQGIGSEFLYQMASAVADRVVAYAPTKVYLMGGLNDIYGGYSDSQLKAACQSIITAVEAAGAEIILCQITPHNSFTSAQNYVKHVYNAWIQTLGKKVAFTHDAVAATPGGNTLDAAYAQDDVHLNTDGYYEVALAVAAAYDPEVPPTTAVPFRLINGHINEAMGAFC